MSISEHQGRFVHIEQPHTVLKQTIQQIDDIVAGGHNPSQLDERVSQLRCPIYKTLSTHAGTLCAPRR